VESPEKLTSRGTQNGSQEEMKRSFEPSSSFVGLLYADVKRDESTKPIPPATI
jgi:hypothetical protein